MQLESLRERVCRSEYQVDAQAVAGAILAKLTGMRTPPERPA
jgi:anti-sigma28 factor (negative regulator of flagellin synthesis)